MLSSRLPSTARASARASASSSELSLIQSLDRRDVMKILSASALIVATDPTRPRAALASQASPATVSKYLPPSKEMEGYYIFSPAKDATPVCAMFSQNIFHRHKSCHATLKGPKCVLWALLFSPCRLSGQVSSAALTPLRSQATGAKSASLTSRTETTVRWVRDGAGEGGTGSTQGAIATCLTIRIVD